MKAPGSGLGLKVSLYLLRVGYRRHAGWGIYPPKAGDPVGKLDRLYLEPAQRGNRFRVYDYCRVLVANQNSGERVEWS